MKKSINQWCFPTDWEWKRVFGLMKDAKFDAIELCIDYTPFFAAVKEAPREGLIAEIAKSVGSSFVESKSLTFDSSGKRLSEVRGMAEDHGIAISTLLTIAQFHYTLTSPDDAVWQEGIDLVSRLIDMAVELGAPALLVVPGLVTSQVSYDFAYKRLEDAIWRLKEKAEARNVKLGIENIWGKILYSPLEMRSFIDTFQSSCVGVHFDVGNVVQYGYPDQWIRILGRERLFNIHLKDYDESINNIRGFTHLFQGSVPWDRVREALADIRYEGYLIAEVPPYPYCPEEGIWDISRKMDVIVGS
jgi:L-ribulose-5-phosphate 3-epimerase